MRLVELSVQNNCIQFGVNVCFILLWVSVVLFPVFNSTTDHKILNVDFSMQNFNWLNNITGRINGQSIFFIHEICIFLEAPVTASHLH